MVCQHFRTLGVQRGDLVHDVLRAAVRRFPRRRWGSSRTGRTSSGRCPATSTLHVLGESAKVFLQLDELGEVGVVERVGLAHVAAGVELVVPDLARRCAFLEEQHHGLHARALERAAGAVEHGVQVAAFQQQLPQADGGVVGVGEEGVLDDDAAAAAGLEDLDEVLEEQERGLAGADGEVLLHLLAFLAAEGRIGQDHVEAVLLLNVGEVLGRACWCG